MPRLEVETIADFKVLFEIGALTPDMSIRLSRILLGEEPGAKRKKQKEDKEERPVRPADTIREAWDNKGQTGGGIQG